MGKYHLCFLCGVYVEVIIVDGTDMNTKTCILSMYIYSDIVILVMCTTVPVLLLLVLYTTLLSYYISYCMITHIFFLLISVIINTTIK